VPVGRQLLVEMTAFYRNNRLNLVNLEPTSGMGLSWKALSDNPFRAFSLTPLLTGGL
jgi:hypothetical protein